MNFYGISDFTLCSTLLSMGYKLIAIDRPPTGRAEFLFERSTSLDETVQAFWRGDLIVEPQSFAAAQKSLKARLYGDKTT